MPVTYTVTESCGHQHTRKSAGHLKGRYTHAVVLIPQGGKAHVSYCSSLQLAQKLLSQTLGKRFSKHGDWKGERANELMYPDAKMYPVEAVVK